MYNAFIIAAILAAESGFIWHAARRGGPFGLRGFIVIQMILIILFGSKLFLFFGYATNVTGAFYASALVAVALVYQRGGLIEVRKILPMIIYSMIVVYLLTWLLAIVRTTLPQNIGMAEAISAVIRYQPPVIFASLIATIVAILALIKTIDRYPALMGTAAAICVAQTIDSLLFYPLAFSDMPLKTITEIMLSGLAFKLVCSAALIPVYFLCRLQLKQD